MILLTVLLFVSFVGRTSDDQWFVTGQNADLMVSGVGFNNSGGALMFDHPSDIASDGTHFLLCDQFNNRILIWNTPPASWNAQPDLVLGQPDFVGNDPGTSKSRMNWPASVSIGSNGRVAVADTNNDRILVWNQFPAQSGQAADISIDLPAIPGPDPQSHPYMWPWGVWTDGTRLAATATFLSPGAVLFWNSLTGLDDQIPDYTIHLPQFGTPRKISSDGSTYFFVSDHNATVQGNGPGTFCWNSFPQTAGQPYDFFWDEGTKGSRLPNGQYARASAHNYLYASVPTSADQQPVLSIQNPYLQSAGGMILSAGGRLYVLNDNGNNVQVFNGIPTSSGQLPDFALGSPSIEINTLETLNILTSPNVATDGTSLFASSDFAKEIWIWRSLPQQSGQAPDAKIVCDEGIQSNALWGNKFVAVGRDRLWVWESLPLNGEAPSYILRHRIGGFAFDQLMTWGWMGVALDDKFLYLTRGDGAISVWRGIPRTGNEYPWLTISVDRDARLWQPHSDGKYPCVVGGANHKVYIFRVADIESGSVQPFLTLQNPADPAKWFIAGPTSALTFNDGKSFAIANTSANYVLIWEDLADVGDLDRVVVLGQPGKPGIGINRLFYPAFLAASGHRLWVGEMKFSHRLVQFSYAAGTGGASKVTRSVSAGKSGPGFPVPPATLPAPGKAAAQAAAFPAMVPSPTRTWNTYSGVSPYDGASAQALDSNGNIYLTGYSQGTWGAPLRAFAGGDDAFVAKFSPEGALIWNTFLGGAGNDAGTGIGLDLSGNIYVSGCSYSDWGSPLRSYGGGEDAFVAKLDAGGALVWNTFLGGAGLDGGLSLATGQSGSVYVAGETKDTSWGSPVNAFSGSYDGFAAKLDANGALLWNSFQGGAGVESNNGIASDAAGNVYISGKSQGSTWGTSVRAYSGGWDAHVAKLDGSGHLQWNTFLGAAEDDYAWRLAVDASGNPYTAGFSRSSWGSSSRPYFLWGDGFVAKIDGTTGLLRWNTFLGGGGVDEATEICLDGNGNVYAAGWGGTWGTPANPHSNGSDSFIARLNAAGGLVWNAFFGEWGLTFPAGLSVDGGGNVVLSGDTCANWGNPITAFSGSGWDAFVVKVTGGVSAYPMILLSKSALNFGAEAGGASTSSQSITISNGGGGTLVWTATPSAPWITATPGSGTGGGTVLIGVNPAGLGAGIYHGSVSFADSNAGNSPQPVAVTLTVYGNGETSLPFGDFATPLDGTTDVTGAIPVTGWVLDDIGVDKVEIWRDPVLSAGEVNSLYFIGTAIFVEGARPDVETAYPGYPVNSAAGWGYMLLTNFLPNQGNGAYKLYAIATDKDGHTVTLGTKTITCDNAHAVKPFGTIDTPAQGGDASGNPYLNFGWVLTPLPKTISKNGATIQVFVDSVMMGTLGTPPNVYNQYRPDVSGNFPGLNNTGGPGTGGPVGAYFLNTTLYTSGVHTIWWIAYDDAGAADGIGSRYFNIVNTGSPQPMPAFGARMLDSSELALLLPSFAPAWVKTGFDLGAEFRQLWPDRDGILRIEILEVSRVEIDLGREASGSAAPRSTPETLFRGYLFVRNELRPLPVGSTLDLRTGRFSWMPGPGFLGDYQLVFVENAGGARRAVKVVVRVQPKRWF